MKKKFVLIILLLFMNPTFAQEGETIGTPSIEQEHVTVLEGNIEFDWIDISQVERDVVIQNYQDVLFKDDTVYRYNKKEFRTENKDYLKDTDYKRHYMLVYNNVKETDKENLCGFYQGNILISYAVQYKNDLRSVYYYDALGKLRYIDKMSENYPNYPYSSKQYRANGKLVSAIYFISHDIQYMYNSDESFKGVWYKDKMFNNKAKQILTRSNW